MDKAWWMVKLFKIARAVLRRGRQGVSKVAFKLTKSNISQIRLWLLLREWKKGEGAGKNEVKYTRNGWGNRCNASKKESWGSWWGMIEKNKDRQTHLLKKGGGRKRKRYKEMRCMKVRASFKWKHMWVLVLLEPVSESAVNEPRDTERPCLRLQRDFITCMKSSLNTHWPTSSISARLCYRRNLRRLFMYLLMLGYFSGNKLMK